MSDTVVRIVIDASQARRGGSQAEQALDRVGAATRRLDGALGRTTVNISTFGRSLAGLKGAGAALILADITRRAGEAADAFALMDAKLKVSTKNWGDNARAQEDVMRISRTTRSEMTSTAVLYGKLATTSKTLNASQAQVATATETVTKALKVSGASAGETASTVLQLGQALASGRLNGDEFRSLAENAPRLMKLLADSMNVPIGNLKKMASEGQLTSDKLVRAFTDQKYLKELEEEFRLMPKTFGDAATAVENLATATFGAFNQGGQFSQALYDFADQGSANMASIMDRANELGGDIRDTFAGLYNAFQPLQDGGINAADEISKRWKGLRDEIADVLGLVDNIRNFGRGYSLLGGEGSGAAIELSGLNGQKMAPASNMRGNFLQGHTESRISRARQRLNAELRDRMGDANFNPTNWTEQQYRAALAKYPKRAPLTGGTGVLRTPPGTSKSGGRGGSSRMDVDTIMNSIGARVTSGYRSWEHNKKVGGQPTSYHLTGNARDIAKTPGMSLDKIVSALKKQGYDVVEKLDEGDHFHVAWKGKGDKSRSDGEKEADRARKEAQRDAERRIEQEAELFSQMDNQLALAKLMPAEAEKLAAHQELQKIRGKEISAEDKKRLDLLLDQTRAAKLLTDMRAANDNNGAELKHQKAMMAMTDKEAAMSEAAWEFESRALAEKVDITDALFQKELAIVKARAGETYEIQKQNRMLKDRESLLSQYSPAESERQQREQFDFDRNRLGVLRGKSVADGGITEEQYRRAMDGIDRASAEIAAGWQREFGGRISNFGGQLGEVFDGVEGKFGKAMASLARGIEGAGRLLDALAAASTGKFSGLGPIGGLIDILGNNRDGTSNALGKAAAEASKKTLDQLLGTNGSTSAFKNPLSSLSKGFDGFKGDMKSLFGKGGDFTKGLGSVLGKAGAGAGIGGVTSDLAGALGIKLNKTGSQIGGAIGGSVLGPLGAVGGSIIGGIFGNMFSKPKHGTATLSGMDDAVLSGNKNSIKQLAGGAASSVQQGLSALAQQLGGTIGAFDMMIGQYDGKWRVRDSSQGWNGKGGMNFKGSSGNGLTDFGKDGEAEAIAFAIQTAVKQGALTGISDFSKRVLEAAKDLDKAVNLAIKYETIVKDLAMLDDPIGTPLKQLNKEFEALRKEMTANAASAAEMANVDRYYMLQREKMLEDQLSSIKSLQDKLMGSESGLSGKTRLDAQMAEFRKYQSDIAAGKTVDPTKFADLGSSIFDTARELYGTSGPMFQNIRSELLKSTNDLKTNVESIYASGDGNTSVVAAVDKGSQLQAEAIKEAQKANAINEQILAELQRANQLNDNQPYNPVYARNGIQSGTV